MNVRIVNPDDDPRKKHFAYFSKLAYPYVGLTVNVDITAFLCQVRARQWPFFLAFCYCVSEAANGVAEFRRRISNHQIIEYEHCKTSHTVALEDGTYCYCNLDSGGRSINDYLPYATEEQEKARRQRSIEEDEQEALGYFFVSTIPWVSYTSIIQPVPIPADSNPRITWGKYFEQDGKTLLPLSVLCHHALVDGRHIAKFYELLEAELAKAAHPHATT